MMPISSPKLRAVKTKKPEMTEQGAPSHRHQRDNAEWSAGLRPGLYGALSRTRRTGGRRSGGDVKMRRTEQSSPPSLVPTRFAWLCVRSSKSRRKQAVLEVLTSFGDVGRIQNRRDHADSPGASIQHGIEILQVDAADGEPRHCH